MSTTEGSVAVRDRAADLGWEPAAGADTGAAPGLHGSLEGADRGAGGTGGEDLARFLGWFSVGLGAMQVAAPRRMTRLIGLRPTRQATTVMQAMGLREMGHGVAILRDPTSSRRVGTRVGGDALDLALLGVALARSEQPVRTLLAVGAVLGVTVLDVLGTRKLS